jgi:hypothetical protein
LACPLLLRCLTGVNAFLAKTAKRRYGLTLPCRVAFGLGPQCLNPHHVVYCWTRDRWWREYVRVPQCSYIQEKASEIKGVQDRSGTVLYAGSKTRNNQPCYVLLWRVNGETIECTRKTVGERKRCRTLLHGSVPHMLKFSVHVLFFVHASASSSCQERRSWDFLHVPVRPSFSEKVNEHGWTKPPGEEILCVLQGVHGWFGLKDEVFPHAHVS